MNQSKTDLGIVNESQLLRFGISPVTPERSGIPRAMVLTVSFVVSLVIGLSCHHPRRDASASSAG
jgi:hypothetical protein